MEVEESWGRILSEVNKIEQRKEMVLIVGDLNKHIGNDELGVKDNHAKISHDREFIRDFTLGITIVK